MGVAWLEVHAPDTLDIAQMEPSAVSRETRVLGAATTVAKFNLNLLKLSQRSYANPANTARGEGLGLIEMDAQIV